MGRELSFDTQLKWTEEMLVSLLSRVETEQFLSPLDRERAREGIQGARAELAHMQADIFWDDEDLPF